MDDEHFVACQAMAVVGIVLREVAEAIDVEWGGEADDPSEVSAHLLERGAGYAGLGVASSAA